MSQNVQITPGVGQAIAADQVTDGNLSTVSVQYVKMMDGALGGTNKASVNASGQQSVSVDNNPTLGPGVAVIGALVGNQTVQVTNSSPIPVSGNLALSGNVALASGNNTIGALIGNQTVQVTSGNVGITGNVSLGAGTNVIGHIIVDSGNITASPIGNQSVVGPTADGSAAATPPVLIAGTVDGTGTGNVSVPQISANGQVAVNLAQVGNTTVVTGGVAGTQGIGGLAASGVAVAGNPLLSGARAASAEATAVTDGQAVALAATLSGKLINLPYTNKENMVRGTVTTGNTSAATIIAAQGANQKIYVTGLQFGNTGNTTVTVTMNDSASSVFIVPTGGGSNINFPVPLVTAGNVALTMTASGNTTSLTGSGQGYFGL